MADKRADQLKEITERLEQGVKDIFTSEMYTKYLLTMSKFHNYSFNNTLLIAMQRPDATLVAGYNAWKNKFNRYVKKGEKGIQIIAPAPVKEREEREKIDKDTGLTVLNESGEPEIEVVERVIPRFRVTTVFDYAQTDGEPLPTLEVNELTARVKDYTLLKEAIEQVSPVPIRFGEIEGNAKGYYSHMDKEICVRADMGESQTIKTMIHEVAHAMLHDSDQMKQRGEEKDQLTKETEAESIAFTVCSALGIDTSDYSFPYVASWASGKELKELKDSMDTIRLTAADFLEKLETAVAERSVERMTAMEYAEKLIADKERDKTVFDNNQRNLIVNFAYKLDDRAATEELANNLAAVVAAENTEEINRLMWEAEEKIESLPDGMIGLSEMHEYGYLKDDVLPLTKEGAREWHRLGERIYPLFQDGTAGDFASQEEIEQHDGIFGIKADAWSAILLEKNEEYLEDEYSRPDAALTVISREQALRLFDEGKQIYLIRISPWPVLVTGREEIERGSDYFQIAKEDLEKDKQKTMENGEKAPVEKLAVDLDDFAFDFDFYHYKDSVEDREQAVEALKEQIQAGDVQPIREWLQAAVEESEGESAEKAAELITRMDAVVKEQKIDLVLTKSIARFARNIVDCLSVIELLKNLNPPVGVKFEADNIYTLDSNGRMILTILASVAEEESHSKSIIMNWSIDRRFSRGLFLTPALLGYDKDEEGNLVINPEEAQTVKVIYYLYLNGYSLTEIATLLMEYSRKTKLGRVEWNPGTLAGVLANERHCGDVLARKTFTPNFLTHKSKKNNNDRTQYRQKNHHEAIVSREVFNAANHLRASRNYSKKNRPLPVLSVVEDGILRGYVPFDKDWTGFSAEEYREASESVMKEPDVTVTADVKKRLDLTGYEIVRVQYFSTMQNPAMTISNGRLRFNTACLKKFENVEYVELLLNSVERCIAIRPCDKNNPNAIRWGRLKEGRWCASTLGCRGLAKTLFDIMEWDEDLRYRFRGQFLEQGDNKMMLFAFDEPEMIKVEEIVLPPKENTEEDEGETVKKKIYIFPPEWAGTFRQPITSIAQVGILRQEHYAGNWDVFRPATEIEEMNIFTAESLNELLREAEKIMEGWTDYR